MYFFLEIIAFVFRMGCFFGIQFVYLICNYFLQRYLNISADDDLFFLWVILPRQNFYITSTPPLVILYNSTIVGFLRLFIYFLTEMHLSRLHYLKQLHYFHRQILLLNGLVYYYYFLSLF